MTTRRLQSQKPKLWRESVGKRPYTLQLEERTLGGPVRVQARVNGVRAWRQIQTAYVQLPTGHRVLIGDVRVMRGKGGAPSPESVAQLSKAANDLIVELMQGRDPWATSSQASGTVTTPETVVPSVQQAKLSNPFHAEMTLDELAREAQDLDRGRFLGKSQAAEAQRWSLKTAMSVALVFLGPQHRVRTTTVADLRNIWLSRAKRPTEKGTEGFRAMENNISILLATIRWAALSCPELGHRVPPEWRKVFRADWKNCRDVDVSDEGQKEGPRYTPAEMQLLLDGIAHRKGPPQIRFAADIGGEQRLGQVAEKVFRSQLNLNDGDYGSINVPNSGRRKRGGKIYLTGSQRKHVDEELSIGMLRHVEPLYQQKLLRDYALVPRILESDGAVSPLNAHLPLDKRAAQRQWKLFEAICGVEYVKFRAWYGMRRWASDAIEDAAKAAPNVDSRAASMAQGWDEKSRMNRRYQRNQDEALYQAAAQLRAKAREQVAALAERVPGDPA